MSFTKLRTIFFSKFSSSDSKVSAVNLKNSAAPSRVKIKRSAKATQLQPKAGSVEAILLSRFEKSGWTVRKHLNDPNFRLSVLNGRQVQFTIVDEQGNSEEHNGTLDYSGLDGSAIFRLQGHSEVFNANLTGIMAVAPAQLEASLN